MKVYIITFVRRITIYLWGWGESFSDEVRIMCNGITLERGRIVNAWSYIFGFFFYSRWRCDYVVIVCLIKLLSKEIPLKFDYIICAHDKNFLFCIADYSKVYSSCKKILQKSIVYEFQYILIAIKMSLFKKKIEQ